MFVSSNPPSTTEMLKDVEKFPGMLKIWSCEAVVQLRWEREVRPPRATDRQQGAGEKKWATELIFYVKNFLHSKKIPIVAPNKIAFNK
jgi:hypothetical protein